MIAVHRGEDILVEVGVNQGSIRRFNLMKEDFIQLKFSLTENMPLLVSDYIDLEELDGFGGDDTTTLFNVDRNYYPTFNKDTGGYDYNVQINAYYHQWKSKVLKYNPEKGAAESSFSLTDTIEVHAGLIISNLKRNEYTYKGRSFEVQIHGSDSIYGNALSKGMKAITYSAVTIYGAMDAIAQAFECEWWVVENVIHFGYRKEDNAPIELTLNDEIADATISDSDGVHATRIYAFGGTTNVHKHYRDKLEFTADTIGDGWFYDSKRPVYPDMVRGERAKQEKHSETIPNGEGDRHIMLAKPFPINRVEGEISNLSVSIKSGWFGWKGSLDIEKDMTFGFDMMLMNPRESDSVDMTSFIKQFRVGDIKVMSYPKLSGMYNVDRLATEYTVVKGHSYAIRMLGDGNIVTTGSPIYFMDNSGNKILLSPSMQTQASRAYNFIAYNLPTNGTLCVSTREAEVYDMGEKEMLSISETIIPFQVYKSPHAYNYIALSSSYKIGSSTYTEEDSSSKYESLIGYEFKYDSSFGLSYQATAQSAKTTILVNGETEPREVTINADFEDDGCKISGFMPTGGTKFTFPDIILSKVGGDYFTTEEGGVQTGVVQKNLMLPKGTDYVGTDSKDAIEAIMVFDWIYPKTTLAISNVQPFDEYPVGEENEDGSTTTSYVTTYNITLPIKHYDNSLWVDPSQQFVIFQDGAAAGLRFEVNVESQTEETVTFQLIPNEDYVTWIPNASTIPSVGDNVILDGIDVTFIDSSVIEAAEQEVLAEANRMLSEAVKEDKVADITLSPEYALERGRIALGSQAKLIGVLGDAYDSRVLGFEECLDIPWDKPRYIIGDSNYYNRQASIETKLDNIEKGSITLSGVATGTGGGGTKINIIKSADSTKASDKNVFSALKVENDFLHTKEDDIVEGNVTFQKDITVRGGVNAIQIDATNAIIENTTTNTLDVREDATIGGNQEVRGLQTLHEGFKTNGFDSLSGHIQGAQLTSAGVLTAAGIVTMSFKTWELIYNVIRAQGGKTVLSNAATVERVQFKLIGSDTLVDTYNGDTRNIDYVLLTLKKDEHNKGANPFAEGDILYGSVNSIGESGEVAEGGECTMHVIEEPSSMTVKTMLYPVNAAADAGYDTVSSNIAPTANITLAQRGNTNNEERQTSIFLDGEAMQIVMLQGVNTPRIQKGNYGNIIGVLPPALYNDIKEVFDGIKKNDPVVYAKYGIFQNIIEYDHNGNFVQRENNRGEWNSEATYENTARLYDTVTYKGQLWKCIKTNKGVAPVSGEYWLLLVSKGDDGMSIKVSGSYNTVDAFEQEWKPNGTWLAPKDKSECYVVAGDLYVWLTEEAKWDNVGRFKGDKGDSVTGTITEYAVNQSMTEKPDDKEFYPQYPSSITQGDVLWTRTKLNVENHATEWAYSASRQSKDGEQGPQGEAGKDNTSVQWTLLTNTNRINIIDRETASQNYIDVRVGKNSSKGYEEITDNATLAADGLKVMYYVDNAVLDAKDVVLYSGEPLAFDDGIELALDNDIPLVVENTVVDLFNVKRSITFVLVPTSVTTITDNDIVAVAEVLVINPDYTMAVEWSNNMISFTVDANTKKPILDATYNVGGRVKLGGKDKARKDITIEITYPKKNTDGTYPHGIALSNAADDYGFSVKMDIKTTDVLSSLPEYIEVKASLNTDSTYYATSRINIQGLERGKVGPMGDVGPMVYMAGTHDPKVLYKTIKEDGKLVATLMVYDGKNDYYILKKDIDTVDISLGNTDYWRLAQRFEVIYTKMLMANFGRIASAVFYGRYMFSEFGITEDNQSLSVDGVDTSKIFIGTDTNDPRLSGYWTPQLFLDFMGGGAKFGKLSESFIHIVKEDNVFKTPLVKINMDNCHNVSHQAIISDVTDRYELNEKPCLVVLPSSKDSDNQWTEDGTHCTIVHEYDYNCILNEGIDNLRNSALVVCADARLLTADGASIQNENSSDAWIIWKGRRCKFVFLSSGSMLKLRSVKDGNGNTVWLIENSADFELMDTRIRWYVDYAKDESVGLTFFRNTEAAADKNNLGFVIGSPAFNSFSKFNDFKTDWLFDAAAGFNGGYYIIHAEKR